MLAANEIENKWACRSYLIFGTVVFVSVLLVVMVGSLLINIWYALMKTKTELAEICAGLPRDWLKTWKGY